MDSMDSLSDSLPDPMDSGHNVTLCGRKADTTTKTVVFVDVETTGLYRDKRGNWPKITELALVAVEIGGKIDDTYHILYKYLIS